MSGQIRIWDENVDIFDSKKRMDIETMLRIAADFKDIKKQDNSKDKLSKFSDKDAFELALEKISAIRASAGIIHSETNII